MHRQEIKFKATPEQGNVSAIIFLPEKPQALLVLAHGAGTDMRHIFMQEICQRLSNEAIATLRFNFPYKEKERSGPNSAKILKSTVRSAIATATTRLPNLPLFIGGKSMGGRMTSLLASESHLEDTLGIIFFGFPLHAAGKPGTERADHLFAVNMPMLFLQGPRDALAKPELLTPIIKKLGKRANLHMVEEADHTFKVLKRSSRNPEEVMDELTQTSAAWIKARIPQ